MYRLLAGSGLRNVQPVSASVYCRDFEAHTLFCLTLMMTADSRSVHDAHAIKFLIQCTLADVVWYTARTRALVMSSKYYVNREPLHIERSAPHSSVITPDRFLNNYLVCTYPSFLVAT